MHGLVSHRQQSTAPCRTCPGRRQEWGGGGGVRPTESPKIRLSPVPYIKGNFLKSDEPLGSERNFRVLS